MATRPDQEAIETFMSITGASEATAIQKLEQHGGDLNEAVNAHFNEGDRTITHEASFADAQNDVMDVDDPIQIDSQRPPFSLQSSSGTLSPFSLLDPSFGRSIFNRGTEFPSSAPFVSHPREVREIPIEVKDRHEQSSHSGTAPTIEDVTGTVHAHGPEIHGTVIVDDDEEDVPAASIAHAAQLSGRSDNTFGDRMQSTHFRPSAPAIQNLPDYSNDIEEEMIQAAIEASKRDADMVNQQFAAVTDPIETAAQDRQTNPEDAAFAEAVSLSLKTAEQEKALRDVEGKVGASEPEAQRSADLEEVEILASTNGRQSRLEVGSSYANDESEDAEEQPLVRHRSRRMSSGSVEYGKDTEEVEESPPLSPLRRDTSVHPLDNGTHFQTDEWGGISSEEHDEAVMLEAALFGGIPEGRYRFPYAPHQLMQNGPGSSAYPQRIPRPPSPSLTAQRLIREQQDDEYLASLQADREKELKAKEEAEAALAEEKRKEEEMRRKLEEEQEFERHLAAKEASLPQEPMPDDENAVTLLVRMPDGSRRGRRFLKSDRLQYLFDFIDVGRGVKPGTYKLVRPYPRRAFSDGESALTLDELGLTSKQEALFIELI